MPTFAAIDIGSNSVRLKIARLQAGKLKEIHEDREVTRLGEGVFSSGLLSPESMSETVRVLRRFHRAMQECGTDSVKVVATAALRDARNSRAFLEWVRSTTGWTIEVISGLEEARLIHLGIISTSRLGAGSILMVDLGGGTGHLAIAACRQYPNLHAVVFDLPSVTAIARETIAQSGMPDRILTQDGDFFAGELPEADLYSAGRILHDWDDEKVALLLSAVVERLPRGGALLVAEKLLNEDGVGPLAANMQSLNMLVVTEGRERSLGEYARLLRGAGFAKVEGKRTGVALDAILAIKP